MPCPKLARVGGRNQLNEQQTLQIETQRRKEFNELIFTYSTVAETPALWREYSLVGSMQTAITTIVIPIFILHSFSCDISG